MGKVGSQSTAATWGIPPVVRGVLRRTVLELRRLVEDDFRRQLTALGISSKGVGEPPGGRRLSDEERRAREIIAAAVEARRRAGDRVADAVKAYVREAAFTFLDRAVGLRCLEQRGLLLVDGAAETLIAPVPDLGASSLYWRARNQLGSEASPRELWRKAFRLACAAASERVRVLFDPDAEAAILFPLQATILRVVEALGPAGIPPETWESDEVLGWVYQYWNAEEKDAAYAKLKAKGKLARPTELAAATCLYTERYMVDFLVQNTLGRLWYELHPQSRLPERWPYFVPPPEPSSLPAGEARQVRDITLLDPACGSGHFLLRAFDLFREMYAEEGLEDPAEVPALILERNLYGTDIDARAVQIAALALYLKGCSVAGPDFRPRRLNLVAADVHLPHDGHREALLARFEDDREAAEALEGIWEELRDAPLLGSLLHPERALERALARRRVRPGLFDAGRDDPDAYRRELLAGLREHVEGDAPPDDLGRKLFGEEVRKGVSLVELLSDRYDVVVTNPPYAGSGNLDEPVKGFVEREYADGKRDLYAAFILRCLDFARRGGYVGMVTQQSWLFLRSFAKLRRRVLEGTGVTALAHLGEHGFEESAAAGAFVALFALRTERPDPEHRMTAFRLVGPKSPADKHRLLLQAIKGEAPSVVSTPCQADLLAIPETPFVYWLRPRFFELLAGRRKLDSQLIGGSGLGTRDDERFTRCFWEVGRVWTKWLPYAKGGGFRRWAGLDWLVVNWGENGQEIKQHLIQRFPYLKGNVGILIRQTDYYFRPGLTYSDVARSALSCRSLPPRAIFSDKGPGLFPRREEDTYALLAYLNGRCHSYILRSISPTIEFPLGYVLALPAMPIDGAARTQLNQAGQAAHTLKVHLASQDMTELSFAPLLPAIRLGGSLVHALEIHRTSEERAALLHSLEGWNERLVFDAYELDAEDVQAVLEETGTPAGWFPLIAGYDRLPEVSDGVELPEGFAEYFARLERRAFTADELGKLKDRLRRLYEAGPGSKAGDEEPEGEAATGEGSEEAVLGAHIPIPAETFLEELSQKLEVHPVSVYWLLEELRTEGVVSPPDVRRAVEDWVQVALLLMLGYRWPEQDRQEQERGPAIAPDLVADDGIIPLVPCGTQPTAADRIRTLLERRFGEEGAARSEEEFRTWMGRSLDDWLRRDFFACHVRRFKQRPIAWHLTSPEGTFQALVLYHRLSRTLLQRLRATYAGAVIGALQAEREKARKAADVAKVAEMAAQIEDVEEFRATLERIERGDEPRYRIRCRWKGEEPDGRPGPYAPDLDDGVKVNIRPFQEAGLLAVKGVIKRW